MSVIIAKFVLAGFILAVLMPLVLGSFINKNRDDWDGWDD